MLRYEDRFFDDISVFDKFAAAFPKSLRSNERDALFQATRRDAIENIIRSADPGETVDDGFPGHLVHVPTQWHAHHLNRRGKIGRWRDSLSHMQVAGVGLYLGSWMRQFGYRVAADEAPTDTAERLRLSNSTMR